MQYRSANTLPREIGLFRGADGQIYASSAPSQEVMALRDKLVVNASKVSIKKNARIYALPAVNDGVCEIIADFDAQKADSLEFVLSNKAGDRVVMRYNPAARTFSLDRRESGIVDFSESFPAVTVAPTFETNGKVSLRIFIDRSSIEIFGNGGRFVMTNIVFPNEPYCTLSVSSAGGNARLNNLKIYSMKTK